MNPKTKLEEIISLHSVIDSAWLRIEWLDESLAKTEKDIAQAEKKYEEVVARREQLMYEMAKWAVLEGVAGVDDHFPMLRPVDFVITMHNLLEKQSEVLPKDETLH
jgi:recombinational DNA repair ATPase RecF